MQSVSATEQEGGLATWRWHEWSREDTEAANSLSWVTCRPVYWAEVHFGQMEGLRGRWAQYQATPKAEVTSEEPSWLSH